MAIQFNVRRSKKRLTNASISVGQKGVTVNAPFWMPDFMIAKFVEENKSWIKIQQARFPPKMKKQYRHGATILYMGNQYTISVSSDSPGRTRVELMGDEVSVSLPAHLGDMDRSRELERAMIAWYMENGIARITDRTNLFAEKLSVSYNRISLKKVSSIWGSCTVGNNLNFNRNLILAPGPIIDYVIIHELSHLIHRDHSSRFWAVVRSLDPEYKQHRRWLRDNRHLLEM